MKPINNVLRVVDEYSKWLSHEFPEVGRVLDNLRAELSGEGLNAGTPGTADNCVISSLREQLRRNRAALAAPSTPPEALSDEQIDECVRSLHGPFVSTAQYPVLREFARALAALAAPSTPPETAKPWAQKTALEKAPSLIIELETAAERFTRYSNDSIDGLLQAAADVIRALAAPSTPAALSRDEIDAWLARRIKAAGSQGITDWHAFGEEIIRWTEAKHERAPSTPAAATPVRSSDAQIDEALEAWFADGPIGQEHRTDRSRMRAAILAANKGAA